MAKTKKIYPVCQFCKKDITGKVETAYDKPCCFKCFIPYRRQEAWLDRHKPDIELETRIKAKRFYCLKCKEPKSDLEVIHNFNSITCSTCGKRSSLRLQAILKKIHKL